MNNWLWWFLCSFCLKNWSCWRTWQSSAPWWRTELLLISRNELNMYVFLTKQIWSLPDGLLGAVWYNSIVLQAARRNLLQEISFFVVCALSRGSASVQNTCQQISTSVKMRRINFIMRYMYFSCALCFSISGLFYCSIPWTHEHELGFLLWANVEM